LFPGHAVCGIDRVRGGAGLLRFRFRRTLMATTYPDSTVARSSADALGEKAHGGIDRLSTGAHGAVDRAASVAAMAADRLGAKSDELLTARDEWMDATRGYVREHPLAALGIALAAGYLLSRFTGR
jgi:ElaB/YqjD/DUF883 family membrane-anchored ribosome-binding protein